MRGPRIPRLLGFENNLNSRATHLHNSLIFVDHTSRGSFDLKIIQSSRLLLHAYVIDLHAWSYHPRLLWYKNYLNNYVADPRNSLICVDFKSPAYLSKKLFK